MKAPKIDFIFPANTRTSTKIHLGRISAMISLYYLHSFYTLPQKY